MKKQMVIFKPVFIFDPSDTWQHVSQIESDMIEFFASHSMNMDTIKSLSGSGNEKIYLISSMDVLAKQNQQNRKKEKDNMPKARGVSKK